MHKIVVGILVGFCIVITCSVGAMIGAIAGAVLLPVKVMSILSDDSTGKSSDKI